ncbi:hypothetical protein HV824_35505, partial [Myxococcus sp. AM009]|nr:hypothetical protein [Myxococcus sp. AM009]
LADLGAAVRVPVLAPRIHRRVQVDASGGGAGLGLRRILEHSDVVAVRVAAGRESRVLCVVDLGEARRRAAQPKSLLFCLQ